jgi:Cu2+-exporting ATPase
MSRLPLGQAVPLAQSKADVVLVGRRSSAVVATGVGAQPARRLRVVRQNLAWAALYNAVPVFPWPWAGWLPAWLAGLGMALSSLGVVRHCQLRLSTGLIETCFD